MGSTRSTSSSKSSTHHTHQKPPKSSSMAESELKGSVSAEKNPRKSSNSMESEVNGSNSAQKNTTRSSNPSSMMESSQATLSFSKQKTPRTSASSNTSSMFKRTESSKSASMVESHRRGSFSEKVKPRNSFSYASSSKFKQMEMASSSSMMELQGAARRRSSVSSHASSKISKLSSMVDSQRTRSINLSPSSICSPARTEFSTPLNQSPRFTSIDRRKSCSYEIEEEINFRNNTSLRTRVPPPLEHTSYDRKNQMAKMKAAGTHRNPLYDSSPARSEYSTHSTLQELLTARPRHSFEETVSTYEDSEIGAKSTTSERYFHDFISGIRLSRNEVKLETWKDMQSNKLMSSLKKKEDKLDEWVLEENTKAEACYKETEMKVEKEKREALAKRQKKMSKIEKRVSKKLASAARKIVTGSNKVPWWKKLLCMGK